MRIFCAQPLQEVQYDWLFSRLRGLERHGHRFVSSANDADVVFFENRVGFHQFDRPNLDAAVARRVPVVVFDYLEYHAQPESLWFDWHRRGFEGVVPDLWADWMRQFFQSGMVRVYFMHHMPSNQTHPPWVYPIDYAWRPQWRQPEESYEQFAARPYDVCFAGGSCQPRATTVCHLIESRRIKISWDWYQPVRRPWQEWMDRHRQAKFYLQVEGWGIDDRHGQLGWVAAMLRQKGDYRWARNWQDGVDCIDFCDCYGNPREGDIDRVEDLCRRPEVVYEIYRAGREALLAHYNEQAIADYVHDTITRHGI